MPKAVSAEATNGLETLVGYVVEQRDEVIVERQGRPEAVLMSFAAYQEVQALRRRDEQRRADALARLRALRERVRARNEDLTEEEAEAIADRFVHEVIDDMVKEGKLTFEHDPR